MSKIEKQQKTTERVLGYGRVSIDRDEERGHTAVRVYTECNEDDGDLERVFREDLNKALSGAAWTVGDARDELVASGSEREH